MSGHAEATIPDEPTGPDGNMSNDNNNKVTPEIAQVTASLGTLSLDALGGAGPADLKIETGSVSETKVDSKENCEVGSYKREQLVNRMMSEEDFCAICRHTHTNPKVLSKCTHKFCTECIDAYFKIKPQCPECFAPYGVITGNQPPGHMSHYVSSKVKLAGYSGVGTIVIQYSFSDGIQTDEHPHPGKMYYGTSRTAYLPDNEEGRKVLQLLKTAFDRKLTFTVGRSRTTGADDQVTWNDVHHKTSPHGGQEGFGYPDPTYLQRVTEELAAKGVTE